MQSLRFVFMVVDSKKVPDSYSLIVFFFCVEVLGTTVELVKCLISIVKWFRSSCTTTYWLFPLKKEFRNYFQAIWFTCTMIIWWFGPIVIRSYLVARNCIKSLTGWKFRLGCGLRSSTHSFLIVLIFGGLILLVVEAFCFLFFGLIGTFYQTLLYLSYFLFFALLVLAYSFNIFLLAFRK